MTINFYTKLGNSVISEDIYPMFNNGEQHFALLNKYDLKLAIIFESCNGVFTRIHQYKPHTGESVLNYVFISSDLEKRLFL